MYGMDTFEYFHDEAYFYLVMVPVYMCTSFKMATGVAIFKTHLGEKSHGISHILYPIHEPCRYYDGNTLPYLHQATWVVPTVWNVTEH